MKKYVSLLLLLLLCSTDAVFAQSFKELDAPAQRALINKHSDAKDEMTKGFDFNCSDTICCKRGPRGHRGKRGRRGRRGQPGINASCGVNELFLNANMLTGVEVEGGSSPMNLFPYGDNTRNAAVSGWALQPDEFGALFAVGANFDIPNDLDNTQPVTVVLHLLIANNLNTTATAQIQLQIDYKNSGDILGVEAPATGFADTQNSAIFAVVEPPVSTPNDSNLRQISVPISLDITKINGAWAFMQVYRIDQDYQFPIYLSTISVQYTRLCLVP